MMTESIRRVALYGITYLATLWTLWNVVGDQIALGR